MQVSFLSYLDDKNAFNLTTMISFGRCDDLNSRASSLEVVPSCALPSKIVKELDILAGDPATLAESCNATAETTCVEDVVDFLGRFT